MKGNLESTLPVTSTLYISRIHKFFKIINRPEKQYWIAFEKSASEQG
jgi:hypothetical protein